MGIANDGVGGRLGVRPAGRTTNEPVGATFRRRRAADAPAVEPRGVPAGDDAAMQDYAAAQERDRLAPRTAQGLRAPLPSREDPPRVAAESRTSARAPARAAAPPRRPAEMTADQLNGMELDRLSRGASVEDSYRPGMARFSKGGAVRGCGIATKGKTRGTMR